LLVIDDELSHVSVRSLDAPLSKIASIAEVLAAAAARDASVVRAGATHHQHRQVTGPQAGDITSNVNYFAKRFMSNDQVWRANWWCAVAE
jgi:hypothetical protein